VGKKWWKGSERKLRFFQNRQSWKKASQKRDEDDIISMIQSQYTYTYMHKSVLNQVENPFAREVVKEAGSSNIFIVVF